LGVEVSFVFPEVSHVVTWTGWDMQETAWGNHGLVRQRRLLRVTDFGPVRASSSIVWKEKAGNVLRFGNSIVVCRCGAGSVRLSFLFIATLVVDTVTIRRHGNLTRMDCFFGACSTSFRGEHYYVRDGSVSGSHEILLKIL
jgi:hypothetical protein